MRSALRAGRLAAVMEANGFSSMFTFDASFDAGFVAFPGLERISS